MLATRLVLAPALAFALTLPGAKEKLVFAPAAGTTLQRTCSSIFALELESMSVQFNGEDIPAEYLGDMDGSMGHEERFTVTDVIEVMGDGRPTRLVRSFDELSGKETATFGGEDGEETKETPKSSELEGKRVVFAWNEDDGAHEAAFAEGVEGDEALLADLEEDMDLRELLPGHEVAPGDHWEIEPVVFDRLLSPGGDLALVGEDEEEEDDDEDSPEENMTGSVVATYRGSEVVEGVKLAVIELAVEVETFEDEEPADEELPAGFTSTQRLEMEIVAAGELRWDLEHGHLAGIELAGDLRMRMAQTMSGEMESESFEQAQTMEFLGPITFAFTVERR
ncbi:MAG: hypothetical protein ABL998_06495 [Planctomycetota bacterium]